MLTMLVNFHSVLYEAVDWATEGHPASKMLGVNAGLLVVLVVVPTQALSSLIYYCYFCCIDIQYCACIFKLVCYATVYCEI